MLFHAGLSPAVAPGTPLNGACHSAGAPPGFNWSGEEREMGGESEHKGGSEEAGEQGLGRTCAEDTNASYTEFSLNPRPLRHPAKARD